MIRVRRLRLIRCPGLFLWACRNGQAQAQSHGAARFPAAGGSGALTMASNRAGMAPRRSPSLSLLAARWAHLEREPGLRPHDRTIVPPRHPQRLRRPRLRHAAARERLIDEIKFVHPKDMQDGLIRSRTATSSPTCLRGGLPSRLRPPFLRGRALRRDTPANHVIDATAPSAARWSTAISAARRPFPQVG